VEIQQLLRTLSRLNGLTFRTYLVFNTDKVEVRLRMQEHCNRVSGENCLLIWSSTRHGNSYRNEGMPTYLTSERMEGKGNGWTDICCLVTQRSHGRHGNADVIVRPYLSHKKQTVRPSQQAQVRFQWALLQTTLCNATTGDAVSSISFKVLSPTKFLLKTDEKMNQFLISQ
jgi:hypothetical protein